MQNEGTPAEYLRVKAVAERFDVSPSTIYRAIKAGELDALQIGGNVRIPANSVTAFEKRSAAAFRAASVATEAEVA